LLTSETRAGGSPVAGLYSPAFLTLSPGPIA
jgi:hypothetical protein